jgi:hypothetical protein
LARVVTAAHRALNQNDWRTFLLLLCGKVALEDRPLLAQLVADGILKPPAFVPPPLRDARWIAGWLRRLGEFDEIPNRRGESHAAILQASAARQ